MLYIICDADNVIQDIASIQSNLARGLPCLEQGGHLYEVVDSSMGAWIGDHFDGSVLTPDSPLRATAIANEEENMRLGKVMDALVDVKVSIEADVGALRLDEVREWLAAINNVATSPNAAKFTLQWAAYEKKRTLFEIELIRHLVR